MDPAKTQITPVDFYSKDSEKTKLNWFCFEYACGLEIQITGDRRLVKALGKKGVGLDAISRFCIHFAKQMKGPIFDTLSGKTKKVNLRYEEIEAFFPDIGDKLVDRLLTKTGDAWESQLDLCVVCPTRCISEKNKKAPMFDDPIYWD